MMWIKMPWEFLGKRTGDFMKNHLLYESMEGTFKRVLAVDHPDFLTIRERDTFAHYMDNKTAEEFSKYLSEEIKLNPKLMKQMLETGRIKFNQLLAFCKTLKQVDHLSNASLAVLLEEYFRLYREPYPYFLITIFSDAFEKENTPQTKKVIDIMTKLRWVGRDSFNKAHELSAELFDEVGKRLNLTIKEIKFLKPEEIVKALTFFEEKISKRQSCHFIHREGKSELKHEKYIVKEEEFDVDTQQLKGQGTFAAKYKGSVRLIYAPQDMKDMKKGEVMVTRMTTPLFVTPDLKKAGAIITDEGGITCHAAIVSREFKIPCIMGTKHATKVLKTGDIVELDCVKGIVRRL